MAKTAKSGKAGGVEYADGPDTATLERPDSTRSQRAMLQTGPADRALSQTQTPGSFTYPSEDGSVTAYAVTKQLADGTEVTEVQSKSGGERGWAASGTVGKTATDSNGDLLVPVNLVDGRFGGKVTVGKDGTAKVAAPEGLAKAAKDEGRGHSPAREYARAEEDRAAAKKAAPKARKSATARKASAKTGTTSKTAKSESAA